MDYPITNPVVLGLLARETPCFGNFSEQDTVCSDCPLKLQCVRGLHVRYSNEAAFLDLLEAPRVEREALVLPSLDSVLEEALAQVNTPPRRSRGKSTSDLAFPAVSSGKCQVCHLPTAIGDAVVLIPGKGVRHAACVS